MRDKRADANDDADVYPIARANECCHNSNMNNQVSNVEPQATPDPRFTNQTPNLIVAQGTIITKNPHTRIRDTELGHGYWEVIIRVPIARQELLPRPFGRFRTVGDAVGGTVAWPSTYVARRDV
ncbi:hypothetical protein QJS04_geneDACA016792 [Acorus gramineus]|uniref:Transposase Tnp1/En/Spm-like domain-containing protein n=1 Tax=Acorus gramineus TaxID=55184 RepID=A0AAV9BHV0_ACOGR|nr:hypothetical protein QJS04_geneDACA016792 [Acorus gramineus]